MRLVADLHLHSRHSRATSPNMDLPGLAHWAKRKGIDLLGTGDFTHPEWFRDLSRHLLPVGEGVYAYGGGRFMFTTEVAATWTHAGHVRRVHFLLLAPSADGAARINQELEGIGNLAADGRPMLGVSGEALTAAVLGACPTAALIPAHAWTPWYSIFGSQSGFDSLDDALGGAAEHVCAIETGLSSNPPMNWRVSALDHLALVSFSDAHSPSRLGREACVFDLPELSYPALVAALRARDPQRFLSTLEFFPEEGKYHYDGHRTCGVVLSPAETASHRGLCPVCGRPVTVGVMHRVEDLADRPWGYRPPDAIPYRSLVPLAEVLGQALGQGADTKGVTAAYDVLVDRFQSELAILLDLPLAELGRGAPPRVVEAIAKVRAGDLEIRPGYDGQYGEIRIPLQEGPHELPLFS
ncbi:MAG TPA: endonuclease Q family protein [Candidatus Bipolaricaulis anaerobius]|nr:endonuclease Q family protein [Candidatus Bipolaricaulis anaerobius]